jgi:hypothetical protein
MTPEPPVGSAQDEVPRARLRFPPWIGGNDILGYTRLVGLKATPIDASVGLWSVSSIEAHEHRAANLISVSVLIGDQIDGARLRAALGLLPSHARDTLNTAEVQAEVAGLMASKELSAVVSAFSLASVTASDEQIAEVVESSWSGLRSMTVDDPTVSIFPESEVHLVTVSENLSHRFAFVRAFLQFEDNPSLYDERPEAPEGELTFASSIELFSDTTLGLDAYLDPLFLAMSPLVWGTDGPRRGGVVVYSFGKAVQGRGRPTELLHLHTPRGAVQTGPVVDEISREAISSALTWWTSRLNRFFALTTDPAGYRGRDGTYRPRPHFEVLLAVEQLFRHVGSILGQVRDQNAQRMLFFSALDTLAGLGGHGLQEAFSLDTATEALRFVEGDLSGSCDPSVGALTWA